MDTCSEALVQLDDIIMHTFQQCVYHLTKVRECASVVLGWHICIKHLIDSSLFQTLYSLLPALLDTNPFSSEEKKKGKAGPKDRAGSEGEGDEEEDVSTLPPTVAGLVEVYRCSLQLSRDACLSPALTSQTFGYLFFFTNTSLLNTLLERGENLQSFINTVVFAHGFGQRWQHSSWLEQDMMAMGLWLDD